MMTTAEALEPNKNKYLSVKPCFNFSRMQRDIQGRPCVKVCAQVFIQEIELVNGKLTSKGTTALHREIIFKVFF